MFGFGFYRTFNMMGIIGTLFFLVIIGVFVVILFNGLKQWSKNNRSPRLTVPAVVVAKRTDVSHSSGEHHHSSTWYYVTFQVESGDRMEFSVAGHEFGMLVEGDRGRLSFQGTRYQGFERT